MSTLYDCSAVLNNGSEVSLSDFQGKVLLIVNTASACGFTPQYEGLEKLYKEFNDNGFEVLAFPCNQFGKQESGSNDEIKDFCDLNFNISFPLFQKVEVNGDNTHPIYQKLKAEAPGILGSKNIKWNFTKFLVDKDGNVIERYGSVTKPETLADDIRKLL